MSLTGCIKKAGAALSDQDKAAIHEAARRFRKEGKSAQEAGVLAIEAQLEAVRAMLAEAQDKAAAPRDSLRDTPLSGVATHKDPGESAEAVTPAVVEDAIRTAVAKTDRKPSEMKADLLAQIDARMPSASDDGSIPTWSAPTKAQIRDAMLATKITNETRLVQMLESQHQNRVAEAAERIGYVTFRVEGDGVFKVLNTKDKLAEFRKQVERSAGFKDREKKPAPERTGNYAVPFGVERGSGGKEAAFSNMVDEGDMQAATDYAAAVGLDPKTVKLSDMLRKRLDQWMRDQEMAGRVAEYEQRTASEKPAEPAAEATPAPEASIPAAETNTSAGSVDPADVAPAAEQTAPERQEPAHFAEIRTSSRAYWDSTATPAVREYLRAFDAFGADRLERNRIKPVGMSAREWLESLQRRESKYDGARKVQTTGIQALSQKDLWPTEDGSGERLRKAMLAAIKALRGAPMITGEMMTEAFMERATPASEQASPAAKLKYPTTAQGAIDALNADDEAQAVAVLAKLKMEGLKEVGEAIGFRPNYNETVTSFRNRFVAVAGRATKTAREKASRQRALYDKLIDRATRYDDAADHMERAKSNGVADDSTAYLGFYKPMDGGESQEVRIPELLDKLAADVASLRDDPEYAEAAPKVSEKRPRVFEHKAAPDSPAPAQAAKAAEAPADKKPPIAPMPPFAGISGDLAKEAHRGTSHDPDRRGQQEQVSFTAALRDAWDRAARIAGQDEAAVARITEVFTDIVDGYRARYSATLQARSRVMSSMITGPARFPVERNRKRMETERKRAEEASQYLERGIKRLVRAARGPIDNSPESELERVRLNLGRREEDQETMKAANAAIRKGDDDALAELGFSPEQIEDLKKGDSIGRKGFPDYKLVNNNAEIRRLRERLKSAEARVKDASDGPKETERNGVRIVEDAAEDRLRLFFDGKPSDEVRADLKANGFKWSPKNEAWQRQLTGNARTAVQQVLDKHFPDDKPGGQADAQTSQDASGDAPAFSRSPPRVESGTAENGLPTFSTARVSLEFPQETERFEVITEPGETVVNYPIMPSGSFDVVGHVEILVRDGMPTSLLDIEVYDDNRGSGYARQVVEALLAANPAGELNISNIVEGARGFWSKMGVPEQNLEAGAAYDGTLTWETYQQAQDGGAAQGTPGASRGARAQRDAGTAGARAGDLGQVQRHQALIDRITATWENAPRVVVVSGMDDPQIPQAVRREDQRQRSLGATGVPEGFYFDGTVYLVAPELANEADVARVLFHEALGHAGLRGVFGAEIGKVLDLVAAGRQQDMQKMAARYGKDLTKPADRRYVAEEALAMLAQDRPTMNLVQRAVAAVRNFLRRLGLRLELSDNDIIANYILPAQGWIERGGEAVTVQRREQASEGDATAAPADASPVNFSRSIADSLRDRLNDAKAIELPTGYLLGDLLKSTGRVSWWHKTVGTMHDLAQREPLFRPVYDRAQRFLSDVSLYATEAADMAPKVLPKLETLADITKSPLSAADTKKLSAPVFEGTLSWVRDEQGRPVRVETARQAAAAMSAEEKGRAMLRTGAISEQVLRMWQGLPIEQFEAAIETRYEREMLKPGVVWSDIELSSMFGLSPAQIGLYREVRAAVDKSLTHLAVSDIVRFGGSDLAPIADELMASASVADAKAAAIARIDSLLESQPDRRDVLNDTAAKIIAKADTAADLMARGYAPLMRFGRYTVDVLDADGERVFFGMYETEREANKMARELGSEFPRARVTQNTMSQEQFKMFQGVSPETAELFGEMMGLESTGDAAADKAFQQWLKLAKANRSAMKRLIERKGTAGFSEDTGRVLAGFVYSNARQTAKNLHAKPMSETVMNIAKQKGPGELLDVAGQLQRYMMDPQEEAQALRGLLFAQFLGGSVAAGLVNLTQPLMVTFPYLSQFGGVAKAAGRMRKGLADALAWESGKKTTGDAALDAAIKRAEDDGIISPQEVHQLIAQAGGAGSLRSGDGTTLGDLSAKASNFMSKVMLAWGKPFSAAEQFNRRATFIAAYRTAVDQGIDNPAAFAEQAINDTQFVYNKGSRPAWARGAVGSVLFTFKVYSISYVELMARLAKQGPEGRRAALVGLGMLVLTAGLQGLPGADDLDDLIDGLMQRLGYNWSTKTKKREILSAAFGDGLSEFMMRGMSGLPGAPIDVANRLGLGNLIPGTGILTKKDAYGRDVMEILGPAGSLMTQIATAAGKLVEGEVGSAVKAALPVALQNVAQAADMASMGMYRDRDGKKVIDTDLVDAAVKSIGFQPSDVAKVQSAANEQTRLISMNRMREREIADKWARGMFEGDQGMVQEAREELRQWNEENPTSPIRIKTAQLLDRLKAMRSTRAERLAKTAPSEIRASVRRELESAQ